VPCRRRLHIREHAAPRWARASQTISCPYTNLVNTVGQQLQDILDANKITQARVAEDTGLSTKHINWLVKGRAPLTPEVAVLIEEHFPQIKAFPLLMAQLRQDIHKVRARRQKPGRLFEYAPGQE
jgi:plasmid maintenance system antidote protein VapI